MNSLNEQGLVGRMSKSLHVFERPIPKEGGGKGRWSVSSGIFRVTVEILKAKWAKYNPSVSKEVEALSSGLTYVLVILRSELHLIKQHVNFEYVFVLQDVCALEYLEVLL